MDQLQTNLVQDSYQKFVHIVANSYRDFNELGTIRARQAFAIWNKYRTSVTQVGVNMAMSNGILIINDRPKEGNICLLFYCNVFLWKPHAKQVWFSYKEKQKMVVMNSVPICPVVSVGNTVLTCSKEWTTRLLGVPYKAKSERLMWKRCQFVRPYVT